jgi:putative endonuclease|tara:strand:- start:499 stop:738 length:240 start_codon:yes stop_codon:yes gene_type:complete
LSWFVYILKCKDNSFYTGITNDLEKRIKVHNLGKGAKYTKARLPVSLLYCETYQTKGDALRRELEIKKLKRIEKLALVD